MNSTDYYPEEASASITAAPKVTAGPLNIVQVRYADLDENSTIYDAMIAAPSDDQMVIMWSVWSAITFTTALVTTAVLVPLLLSKTVRHNPFNVYLIFLLIPDVLLNWLCSPTCLANALAGYFTSVPSCKFQAFYVIFAISANTNMNAIVARQLYHMLNAARHFRRFQPPTHRQVRFEALCVYLYSSLIAIAGVWNIDHWPHHTRLIIGTACLPMPYDTASSVLFYCLFVPTIFVVPFGYVCWAAIQVWYHKLLPPTGRRRILTIYFFRLAAVFVLFWVPGITLIFLSGAWLNPWVQWAGGSWSHLQGIASTAVSLWKPDIYQACKDFWACQSFQQGDSMDNTRTQQPTSSGQDNTSVLSTACPRGSSGVISVISGIGDRSVVQAGWFWFSWKNRKSELIDVKNEIKDIVIEMDSIKPSSFRDVEDQGDDSEVSELDDAKIMMEGK